MPNTRPLLSVYEWQSRGNCVGRPVEDFFADPSRRTFRHAQDARAKLLCADCPVRQECLEHALSVPEPFGVWGGTTPAERAVLPAPVAHGPAAA